MKMSQIAHSWQKNKLITPLSKKKSTCRQLRRKIKKRVKKKIKSVHLQKMRMNRVMKKLKEDAL